MPRVPLALSWRSLEFAALAVAAVLLFLAGIWEVGGGAAAHAAYLTLMFLVAPARRLPARWQLGAAAWAVAVALLGFVLGSFGLVAIFPALIAVCLVQGFFHIGQISSVTRSPANLVVFSTISGTGTQLWEVAAGAAAGALLALGAATLMRSAKEPAAEVPPLRDRLRYGMQLALGSAVILLTGELLAFPYTSWALLSFCFILAVGTDDRTGRASDRILGTTVGAVLATALLMLPEPLPVIGAILSTVLCVAYLFSGRYPLFMVFLTPAILITTATTASPILLGAERLGAVLFSAVIALAITWIPRLIRRRDASAAG